MQPLAGCNRNLVRPANRDVVEEFVGNRNDLPTDLHEHARFQNAGQLARRARLGAAARERARERFGWDAVIEGTLAVYRRAAAP